MKKDVLKKSVKLSGKYLRWSRFLNKVVGLLKEDLFYRIPPVAASADQKFSSRFALSEGSLFSTYLQSEYFAQKFIFSKIGSVSSLHMFIGSWECIWLLDFSTTQIINWNQSAMKWVVYYLFMPTSRGTVILLGTCGIALAPVSLYFIWPRFFLLLKVGKRFLGLTGEKELKRNMDIGGEETWSQVSLKTCLK